MKLNNKNIRKIIRNIGNNIIKEEYLLYIDDMEYPNSYTLDIFTREKEEAYIQVSIEKNKEYTTKELEDIIKKAYERREYI